MTGTAIRVLIAEDEENLADVLSEYLGARGFAVDIVRDGNAALRALRSAPYDVALLDIVMPNMDGLEVLRQVQTDASGPEVIIITGNGAIDTAVTAMRLGAYDYLAKPYRMAEIEVLIRRAWEKRTLARQNAELEARLRRVDPMLDLVAVGEDMQRVLREVVHAASNDQHVLLLGESGTGKDFVARLIHRESSRRVATFVEIDCEAIAPLALEEELFGLEDPGDRDAAPRKIGKLESAGTGSVLLENVQALDDSAARGIRRAVEEHAFRRIGGGARPVALHARVFASARTHGEAPADHLESALFGSASHTVIYLPALRDRTDDIPVLAAQFVKLFGGARPPRVDPSAIAVLQRHLWPGNVRELRNVIERAVLLAKDGNISEEHVAFGERRGTDAKVRTQLVTLAEVERSYIERVLNSVRWHQGRAATILGISSKTLYRKIREYGFQRPRGMRETA